MCFSSQKIFFKVEVLMGILLCTAFLADSEQNTVLRSNKKNNGSPVRDLLPVSRIRTIKSKIKFNRSVPNSKKSILSSSGNFADSFSGLLKSSEEKWDDNLHKEDDDNLRISLSGNGLDTNAVDSKGMYSKEGSSEIIDDEFFEPKQGDRSTPFSFPMHFTNCTDAPEEALFKNHFVDYEIGVSAHPKMSIEDVQKRLIFLKSREHLLQKQYRKMVANIYPIYKKLNKIRSQIRIWEYFDSWNETMTVTPVRMTACDEIEM